MTTTTTVAAAHIQVHTERLFVYMCVLCTHTATTTTTTYVRTGRAIIAEWNILKCVGMRVCLQDKRVYMLLAAAASRVPWDERVARRSWKIEIFGNYLWGPPHYTRRERGMYLPGALWRMFSMWRCARCNAFRARARAAFTQTHTQTR